MLKNKQILNVKIGILFFSMTFLSNSLPANSCKFSLPIDSIKTENHVLTLSDAELHGSLVYLDTDHATPLVLFISGSGPTDRDGNQTNLKTDCFKLLAEQLAHNEIASFRFDKRGVAESHHNDIKNEDIRFHHFVDDIKLWTDYLSNDGRFSSIIVMGHSLGSLMGMVAAQGLDLNGFISLSGPGKSMADLIFDQLNEQSPFLANGAKPILDSLSQGLKVKDVHPFLANILPKQLHGYLISVFKYNPSEEISKLKIPILIIQGTNDIQITVDDAYALHNGAKNSQIAIIDSMNHILKNTVKERKENILSYNNPDLPVNSQLVISMVEFILELN